MQTANFKLSQLWKQSKLNPLHLFLGIVLSALFLWLAFRGVSFTTLLTLLSQLNWNLVVLSLVLSVVGTLLRAGRWRLLYYPQHHRMPYFHLTGLLFFSQMLNLLIPARVGELARLSLIRQTSPARTLGTIAVEKLLDTLTLLAFLLALPFAVSLPDWFAETQQSFVIISLSLFSLSLILFLFKQQLLALASKLLRALPEKWGRRLQNALDQSLAGLDVFGSPLVGLRLQAWSFLVWGGGVLTNYALFYALGMTLPLSAAIFLLLVLQVGIAVPNIPGKLGIFQYLVVLSLSAFGVEKDLALSYSLILYLVAFVPHIVFGTLFGIREGIKKLKAPS